MKVVHCFLVLFLSVVVGSSQNDISELLMKKIPGISVKKINTADHYLQEYEIMIEQPLDHDDTSQGTFKQRVFLSHYDKKAPVIFVTEGYSARDRQYELSDMLKANQLIVEYRFFGESVPKSNFDYDFLTNDQAMEDLHRIRNLFGKIYCKEWISTGISKGGTTSLIYRSKYPKDVKATVAYVAPLPKAREDERCDDHILAQGSDDCQSALAIFQRNALHQREDIIPMVDSLALADSLTFNRVGTAAAFEYAVLEFTFSLFQWGHDCAKVTGNESPQETFELLNTVVGFDFYSDKTIEYFEPSFYQFMRENGYYGFIHYHIKDLIEELEDFDNDTFGPKGEDLSFNADYLKRVRVWLYHHGDKVLYIQGEEDPWSACGYVPHEKQNALLMTKKGGNHTTRIKSFENRERKKIYKILDKWLKSEVTEIYEDK